jgi:hypothetical protein
MSLTDTTNQVDRSLLHFFMAITKNWRHAWYYKGLHGYERNGKAVADLQMSLTGGCICVIPTTLAIAPSAAIILKDWSTHA